MKGQAAARKMISFIVRGSGSISHISQKSARLQTQSKQLGTDLGWLQQERPFSLISEYLQRQLGHLVVEPADQRQPCWETERMAKVALRNLERADIKL